MARKVCLPRDYVRHIRAWGHKGNAHCVGPPPDHSNGLELRVRTDAQHEKPGYLYARGKRNARPPPRQVEHDALDFGLNLGKLSASWQRRLGTIFNTSFEHEDFPGKAIRDLLLNSRG